VLKQFLNYYQHYLNFGGLNQFPVVLHLRNIFVEKQKKCLNYL